MYYYQKNSRGDVLRLVDQTGFVKANYTYDAWGKLLSVTDSNGNEITDKTHVAHRNPFRYRSYYYDTETGFYYLGSRYYDPEVGRFISPDTTATLSASPMALTDKNLYAYCDNNPVVRADNGGRFWNIIAGAAIGGLISGISNVVEQALSGQDINWTAVGIAAASGAINGAITAACPCMSPVLTGIVQGGLSAATYAVTEKVAYGRDPSLTKAIEIGVTSGVMAGVMQAALQDLDIVQCFAAGTLVSTNAGLVSIEDIKPGDLVWATDPETGETALKEVVQLFRNETAEWIHITVGCEEIVCTPEHPFYSPVKGWTKACELNVGDVLVTLDGSLITIECIYREQLKNPETTYNFEVEDFHTYYVSNTEVLVHNKCGKEHGNSLETTKPAEGYVLKERGTERVLKYGETTRGYRRYTQKYLDANTAYMDFAEKGTKMQMHTWQHEMITDYFNQNGFLPPLNKSFW